MLAHPCHLLQPGQEADAWFGGSVCNPINSWLRGRRRQLGIPSLSASTRRNRKALRPDTVRTDSVGPSWLQRCWRYAPTPPYIYAFTATTSVYKNVRPQAPDSRIHFLLFPIHMSVSYGSQLRKAKCHGKVGQCLELGEEKCVLNNNKVLWPQKL